MFYGTLLIYSECPFGWVFMDAVWNVKLGHRRWNSELIHDWKLNCNRIALVWIEHFSSILFTAIWCFQRLDLQDWIQKIYCNITKLYSYQLEFFYLTFEVYR